jgi:hypothetical protein
MLCIVSLKEELARFVDRLLGGSVKLLKLSQPLTTDFPPPRGIYARASSSANSDSPSSSSIKKAEEFEF